MTDARNKLTRHYRHALQRARHSYRHAARVAWFKYRWNAGDDVSHDALMRAWDTLNERHDAYAMQARALHRHLYNSGATETAPR